MECVEVPNSSCCRSEALFLIIPGNIIPHSQNKIWETVHIRGVLIKYNWKPGQVPIVINVNREVLINHLSVFFQYFRVCLCNLQFLLVIFITD